MFDLLIWDSNSPAPENRRVLLWQGFNAESRKDIFSILDIVEKAIIKSLNNESLSIFVSNSSGWDL